MLIQGGSILDFVTVCIDIRKAIRRYLDTLINIHTQNSRKCYMDRVTRGPSLGALPSPKTLTNLPCE